MLEDMEASLDGRKPSERTASPLMIVFMIEAVTQIVNLTGRFDVSHATKQKNV